VYHLRYLWWRIAIRPWIGYRVCWDCCKWILKRHWSNHRSIVLGGFLSSAPQIPSALQYLQFRFPDGIWLSGRQKNLFISYPLLSQYRTLATSCAKEQQRNKTYQKMFFCRKLLWPASHYSFLGKVRINCNIFILERRILKWSVQTYESKQETT